MNAIGGNTLLLVGLSTVAAAGILYVFVYPLLSGEAKAEKRKAVFLAQSATRKTVDKQVDANARRKQVTDSLKEIESRNKRKKVSLEGKITQAGLSWSRRQFVIYSILIGIGSGITIWVFDQSLIIALGVAIVGGFGLPLWYLKFVTKRRVKKFIDGFPEAIDIIVRGIKAGLPLADCLRVIANEAQEPIRSEFRMIIEAQTMGLSVGEAVDRFILRMPISETSFFSIVINIQQKAGGNLSEALGNLSAVLRDRKKMKGKIAALSSEAKASASIIGSLPFVVGGLVYVTSPGYMRLLWTTTTGQFVMVVCAMWMALGIFVMKKMINFDI